MPRMKNDASGPGAIVALFDFLLSGICFVAFLPPHYKRVRMARYFFVVCWLGLLGGAMAQSAAPSLSSPVVSTAPDRGEHIVVTGGVSLWEWEKFKIEPHDHWWLNFVRASRLRIEQLRQEYGPSARITWLVFEPAYRRRQKQESENLFGVIDSVRNKYGVRLMYFQRTDQLCDYLNRGQDRNGLKIASFDYFGHSNRACFMFDYSNQIGSASKSWLHDTELKGKLHRGIFVRNAEVKAW